MATETKSKELQRQITTDSVPPDYDSSYPPPSYSSITQTDTARPSAPARQQASQAQDHTGSCGVPAARVMAILGTSSSGTSSSKSKTNCGHRKVDDGARSLGSRASSTSSTWNVQGSPLSHFGSLRRWKKS